MSKKKKKPVRKEKSVLEGIHIRNDVVVVYTTDAVITVDPRRKDGYLVAVNHVSGGVAEVIK